MAHIASESKVRFTTGLLHCILMKDLNLALGQLYIFDASEANRRRLENNPSYLSSVMKKLNALLRAINTYSESYFQMHQLIQSNPTVNVKMIFMEHPDLDMRRYNAPTSRTEVAAIFVGDYGEPPANRDYMHLSNWREL
ncbi:hypothetical protein AVEN_250251-1 [Araneus ventricosus]|uniref:Uncharacterized protein n=1 Tax=Araneus ventricosus TaxID=182803 RepID=A0A4Y2FEF9_ARAVE|nr:hypothetical protein AVEN_250251-1 [Araneus ventricosus]